VDYEKYMKPWENQLQDTILLSNVCGSTEWPENGNWKDKYFFINKDILKSEIEFAKLSGCNNFIAAGTNVSNAMVVMLTQCDESGRSNFFNYDKILLIGYDYSWRHGKSYYAFNEKGNGKHHYMRHIHLNVSSGEFGYTSGNLAFSAQWFEKYVRTFNLPVIQCTKDSILNLRTGDLKDQMNYSFRSSDSQVMIDVLKELKELELRKKEMNKTIKGIAKSHYNSFMASV